MSDLTDEITGTTWVLRPGDKVVLRTANATVSARESAELRARWQQTFGDVPVLFVGSDWDVAAVIRQDEQHEPTPATSGD